MPITLNSNTLTFTDSGTTISALDNKAGIGINEDLDVRGNITSGYNLKLGNPDTPGNHVKINNQYIYSASVKIPNLAWYEKPPPQDTEESGIKILGHLFVDGRIFSHGVWRTLLENGQLGEPSYPVYIAHPNKMAYIQLATYQTGYRWYNAMNLASVAAGYSSVTIHFSFSFPTDHYVVITSAPCWVTTKTKNYMSIGFNPDTFSASGVLCFL